MVIVNQSDWRNTNKPFIKAFPQIIIVQLLSDCFQQFLRFSLARRI